MLRKKTLWIGLVIIVLISVGAGIVVQAGLLPADQASDEPELQTAAVRVGDLFVFASGTGTLVAEKEVDLGFDTNGVLEELLVSVGDQVQEGDTLARLEEGESLESYEAAVASAELSLLRAQQALDELYTNAGMETAQAQMALAESQDQLESAEYRWRVQQEGNRASELTISAAEANLALADRELEKAQDAYNEVSSKADDNPAKLLAISNLSAAQQKYDSLLRSVNWYTGRPTEIDQALLDAEVAMAQAQMEDAQREWDALKDGPDLDEVALAEAELANSQAQLARAQQDLEEAREAQTGVVLVAPLDGTVMSISANVGESVNGPILTLADLSQPYLEIFLDETDLSNIRVGYEAEVVFDALPEQTFEGHVVRVDPSLYTSGGVSTIRGLVVLDDPELAAVDNLPVGLNAAVDIIAGRAENALLVPIEALRELSAGQYAVFVLEDGTPKLRAVEVGVMDFSFVEILSGLEQGDVVTTGIVETGS